MFSRWFFTFAFYFYLAGGEENSRDHECFTRSQILKAITNNPPEDFSTKGALDVEVQYVVEHIKSVNPIVGQMDLILNIMETWHDHTLEFHQMNPCHTDIVTTTSEIITKIWTPKLQFSNAYDVRQSQNEFFKIDPNGTISRNFKVEVIAPCSNDIWKFPQDHVQCQLTYSSLIYDEDTVNVKWSKNGATFRPVVLSEFMFDSWKLLQDVKATASGNVTELTVIMKFRRFKGWYCAYVYVPSFLLVAISWLAFCLGTAITGRAILGLGTFVMLLLQYYIASKELPRVSYLTDLGLWMAVCVFYVFASLLELALFSLVARSGCTNYNTSCTQTENETTKPLISESKCRIKKTNVATVIDIIFAILFPVTFIIFTVVYCIVL